MKKLCIIAAILAVTVLTAACGSKSKNTSLAALGGYTYDEKNMPVAADCYVTDQFSGTIEDPQIVADMWKELQKQEVGEEIDGFYQGEEVFFTFYWEDGTQIGFLFPTPNYLNRNGTNYVLPFNTPLINCIVMAQNVIAPPEAPAEEAPAEEAPAEVPAQQ